MAKLALSFKGNLIKVIPVHDGIMTVGRDPACDVHIDSLAVEPVHARLETHHRKTRITDSDSPEGIFVNHLRVNEKDLVDNDIIRIGKHVLRYIDTDEDTSRVPPPPVEAKPRPSPPEADSRAGWLQILSGKYLGKTLKLKSGLTDLGKHGLPPALVSFRDGAYNISSLGDDEIRITDTPIGETSRPLKDGDIIQIGNTKLQFYLQ